jgi:4-aminobutyrate aminotransferase-like enzyme/Ser/Thr protein kinase RdoA (MazF antagonist)
VDVEAARSLARERYGVEGEVTVLPSDRDRNFLVEDREGPGLVLKVSNALEDRDFLEFQVELLERLQEADLPFRVPRPVAARDGRPLGELRTEGGHTHLVRAVDWIPGRLLARVRPRTDALLEQTGAMLGALDRALAGWDPPAARRELQWDLRRGRAVAGEGAADLDDPDRRGLVERVVEACDRTLRPLEADLPTAVIHGDGNDWNVLVSTPRAPDEPAGVVGLIDFGDVVRSWRVGEVAVAAAYAMLDRADPVEAAARVTAGYHAAHPLTEPELDALWALARLRLAVSVVLAHRQRRARPDNDYLSVTEDAAWRLLERSEGVHPRLAACVLREACGLEPHPRGGRVREWLEGHRGEAAPLLDPDPVRADSTVLDFGLESPFLLELGGRTDTAAWTRVIARSLDAAGAEIGVGRYGEIRPWYTADAYRVETEGAPEWRTVHLGLDLFAPAGTPVRAPLAGTVEAARYNGLPLDYGGTVVLRHEVPDEGAGGSGALVFHTLYGHLSRDSAEGLRPGDPIGRGEVFARLGDADENGGWTPHLHLQVLVDPLDDPAGQPGVARPSREAVWRSLSPDPGPLCPTPGAEPAPPPPAVPSLLERRGQGLGYNLSVSYRRPLHVVRGWMQHLYDAGGQPYLDCVNNVAHVGHGHPRVVGALARQAAVLNTNTRYLHRSLLRWAERLTATLPEPLSVCFFVCSGSEANELALRLARAHTGRHDVVVLDSAYHGNTGQLVAMSPYKFAGPGGRGREPWVHVADRPDPYRGRWRAGRDDALAVRYARSVGEACERATERGGAAAFVAEPLPGCGGQIVPPVGYLGRAFERARAAGAVCVADEVQVGFGRVGSRFWGFQVQGDGPLDAEPSPPPIPDIVTLGKPMGNGHPVGAVVTSPEIASSFANGMEYFNTFGGNPVSCAVGLAVLDVLEEEGLQEHALEVGERLRAGLTELIPLHPVIGDVRGRGLFLGVELVEDRRGREPAGARAGWAVERMRDHGILLSTDGPDHNVIKIKPPLPFDASDAARLVETLDRVLGEDAFRTAGGG